MKYEINRYFRHSSIKKYGNKKKKYQGLLSLNENKIAVPCDFYWGNVGAREGAFN